MRALPLSRTLRRNPERTRPALDFQIRNLEIRSSIDSFDHFDKNTRVSRLQRDLLSCFSFVLCSAAGTMTNVLFDGA